MRKRNDVVKFDGGKMSHLSRKAKKRKRKMAKRVWKPLERMVIDPGVQDEIAEETGVRNAYANDQYQVLMRTVDGEHLGEIVHLVVRRIDLKPVVSWDDLQRIKNELCGPELEGFELLPAESRRLDQANQTHLWVLKGGDHLPVGFQPDEPEENVGQESDAG